MFHDCNPMPSASKTTTDAAMAQNFPLPSQLASGSMGEMFMILPLSLVDSVIELSR